MFESKVLKGRNVKNCFIRSATNEFFFNDEDEITNEYLDYYEELAKNEVGIIITGHAFVAQQGRASILQLNPLNPANYSKLKELTKRVHQEDSVILMQLAHSGPKANTSITKEEVIGPSDEENCRSANEEDMKRIVKSFCEVAKVAEETGFDGIQVHCAHGYLLSSFINRDKNMRQDEYGGPIENRLKLVIEIINAIKETVSKDFIIAVKVDADTTSSDEFIQMGKMLERVGVDLIEVSGVGYSKLPKDSEGYWIKQCKDLKHNTGVAVAIVGGIYNIMCVDRCLKDGIDFISLSRPLISEIDCITKWKSGESSSSRCVRCGLCFSKETMKVCVFNK